MATFSPRAGASMRRAVHHLRRRSLRGTVPRLRSSMMATAAYAAMARTKSLQTRLIDHEAGPHGRGNADALQVLTLRGGLLRLVQVGDQRGEILLQRAHLEAGLADRAMH